MNKRLLAYLRKLGLASEATEDQAREMMRSLRGVQATIANLLNYDETDEAQRTSCDLAIRANGYDPESPTELLPFEQRGQQTGGENAGDGSQSTASQAAGGQTSEGSRSVAIAPSQPEPSQRQAVGQQAAGGDGASADGALERVRTIRQLARDADVPDEMLWRAIDENHTVDRASSDFLAHVRQQREGVSADLGGGGAPAGHSRASLTGTTREALVSALLMGRLGMNDPATKIRTYDQDTREFSRAAADVTPEMERAADEGYALRDLSMAEFVARCLRLGGMRVDSTSARSVVNVLQTRSAVASNVLLGVFTQAFGAKMLDSYDRTPDTTQGWTKDDTNPNFFRQERTRMGKMGLLTKHGKGGQADMMDTSDQVAYAKLHRYTGRFAVDEMDIINDRFGALDQASPAEMGEAARQLRPKLIYALLMSNPTLDDGIPLFDAAHNNLTTGALSKAKIQELTTLIDTQTEDGENLDLVCRYIIAPRAMRYDLKEFLRSAAVVYGGTTKEAAFNALSDEDLIPVTDSRLDNGVTDPDSGDNVAGDTNAFYGATRGDGRTIEATYLRGSSKSPEIRGGMSHPGSGEWIMSWDVKQDIGANAIGYRGLSKSTGV